MKKWLFGISVLFVLCVIGGIFTPSRSLIMDTIAGFLGDRFNDPTPTAFVLIILVNNVIVLLVSFVLSPFFGVVPVLTIILNGWVVGVFAAELAARESLGLVLAGLLPHGIIEIPALFIGEAAALSFGVAAMGSLFSADHRARFLPSLRRSLKYLGLACALLVPAALIEVFVTPLLLG